MASTSTVLGACRGAVRVLGSEKVIGVFYDVNMDLMDMVAEGEDKMAPCVLKMTQLNTLMFKYVRNYVDGCDFWEGST